MHDCTEEDFDQFYDLDDIGNKLRKFWNSLLNIEIKDTFKCLNKESYREMFMKPKFQTKLSFYLAPCDNLPWGPYTVGGECIADKDK